MGGVSKEIAMKKTVLTSNADLTNVDVSIVSSEEKVCGEIIYGQKKSSPTDDDDKDNPEKCPSRPNHVKISCCDFAFDATF